MNAPRRRRWRLRAARTPRPSRAWIWALLVYGVVPALSVVAGLAGWLPWPVVGGIAYVCFMVAPSIPDDSRS